MFAENIKGCLTEIFKHIFLIKENKFIENIFFLKIIIPVIKYGISVENQKVPPTLSLASHILKEYLAFHLCHAATVEELLLHCILSSL